MLTKRLMIQLGVGFAPVTVVLLDSVFVGPASGSDLVEAVRSSGATPWIAWIVALFMGHWFHPVEGLSPVVPEPWNYVVFGSLTVIFGIIFLAVPGVGNASDWLPMLMVLLGFGAGSVLWPV